MAHIILVSNPFEPFKDTARYVHRGGVSVRAWLKTTFPGFKEFSQPTICLVNGEPLGRKALKSGAHKGKSWGTYRIKKDDVINFVTLQGDPITLLYILYAVVVVAAIVIALNMPKPALPGGGIPEPDPVYGLQGQRNQNRLGHPIEVPYGRCRLFPSYAARSYNVFEGNEQYQFSLYNVGQGSYELEDFQFEDTALENFEDVAFEVYEPGEPVTMFPDNVVTSSEVAGIQLFGPNEPEFETAGPFTANDAGTLTTLLQVDASFPAGLYLANPDGSLGQLSLEVDFEYREIDDFGAPVGGGTWLLLATLSKTLSTTTPQRYTLELAVAAGRYEVRAVRITNKNLTTGAGHISRWDALRAFLPSTQDYGDTTRIAIKARATNNLNDNSAQRFNVWATRKLRAWNGTTWDPIAATRNPVWAFCDVFQAPYGGKITDQFLTLDELKELADDFDDEERYFDYVFDGRTTVWDAATVIARVGRCRPMLNGSQVTMVRDVPQSVPTGVFTQDNIVAGSFKHEIKIATLGDFDGVEIEYVDPITWKPEQVECLVGDDAGDNLEQIKLPGCTDRDLAYQEGMYIRATRRLLRENISFQTGLEGHIPSYGDLIRVSHDLPRWGTSGLVEAVAGTTIALNEPVTFGVGTYVIGFRTKTGGLLGPYECTAGVNSRQVILSDPIDVEPELFFDGVNQLPIFMFGLLSNFSRECIVVGLAPGEEGKVDVKAVVYDEDVFAADGDSATPLSTNGAPVTPQVPALRCSALLARWEPLADGKVRVSWSPAVSARAYRVDLSADSGSSWDTAGETPFSFMIVDAIVGADFRFRVTPLGIGSIVGATCTSSVYSDFKPPNPPPPPPGGQHTYPDYWPPLILIPTAASISEECRVRATEFCCVAGDLSPTGPGLTFDGTPLCSGAAFGDQGSGANTHVWSWVLNAVGPGDTPGTTKFTCVASATVDAVPIAISGEVVQGVTTVTFSNGETKDLPWGLHDVSVTVVHEIGNPFGCTGELCVPSFQEEWGDIAWGTCVGVVSYWEDCTGNDTYTKQDAQRKFEGSGYYGGWDDYRLVIQYERQLLAGGAWEDAEEIEYAVDADDDGDFEYIVTYPNDVGYRTRVKSWTFGT